MTLQTTEQKEAYKRKWDTSDEVVYIKKIMICASGWFLREHGNKAHEVMLRNYIAANSKRENWGDVIKGRALECAKREIDILMETGKPSVVTPPAPVVTEIATTQEAYCGA